MGERRQLPCSECGAETIDGDDDSAAVELNYTFGGEKATQIVPAKKCPECGEVTPL